jgi:hypothetical protein
MGKTDPAEPSIRTGYAFAAPGGPEPMIKMRGDRFARSGAMNQFKKKDLIFVLAGLSVLLMSPILERFAGDQGDDDGGLEQKMNRNYAASGIFDNGAAADQPGSTGLAAGSVFDGALNNGPTMDALDFSAGAPDGSAARRPLARSFRPGASPYGTQPRSEMGDALSSSARSAAAAATSSNSLLVPTRKIALAGAVMHALSSGAGSAGPSAGGGGPISSIGLVSGKAAVGGGLTAVRPAAGYAGVAGSRPHGGRNEDEDLKKAGEAAALGFNHGPAGAALNKAADQSTDFLRVIPPGGVGAAGAPGRTDKANAVNNGAGNTKNIGDSLAFQKQKAIQAAQIALWAKEQEAGDNKLEALKIRNTLMESFFGALAGALGKAIGSLFGGG